MTATTPYDRAQAAVPSCALDAAGLEAQRRRHARLAPHAERARRDGGALVVEFAAGYDREALDEMVAVERRCCPFFDLRIDHRRRRLTVAVGDPSYAAALEAVADALGVSAASSSAPGA